MISKIIEKVSGLKSVFSARWFKFSVILSAAVIVLLGGVLVWTNLLGPEARERREFRDAMVEGAKVIGEIEDRFKADAYGGQTPEETLQLFITALEKDDLELAAKYFVLNDDGESDGKWLDMLQSAKSSNRMVKSIDLLKSAKYTGESMPGYAGFDIIGPNGLVTYGIELVKNQYSNIWKIESM